MSKEKTINGELAPILGALLNLDAAVDKLRDAARERTQKAISDAKIFVAPVEDLPALFTLMNGVVTIDNLKESLEEAFSNDLRAVGYRRPVGDKTQ